MRILVENSGQNASKLNVRLSNSNIHHNSIIKIYQYARQIQSMHHQQALDSFQSVTVLIKIKKENPSHTVIMFYLAKL